MPSSTSNGSSYGDAVSRLTAQADAIGRLAQDSGGFAAVVAAFESRDPNAFRWTLDHLEMLPHCELICDWVRTKLCVLRCMEVCGPPREKVSTPDLKQFARAIVRLTSIEKLLRRVVDGVACGDGEAFRAALDELELNGFCYLLCHWVCSIIYRRVCEVVCTTEPVRLPDAVNEIRAAGKVIERMMANEKAFDAIGKAAVALNCEILQSTINQAGFASGCEIICELICVWRCVWVCMELCQLPAPVFTSGADGIEEARNFALVSRRFASQPRALGDLVLAVQNRDAKAYGEIIARFGLGPYCFQVCAWVCSSVCYEFCRCVCPPPALQPWFTTVGNFDIYTQIDPTSGLTNTSLTPTVGMPYGGGPNFAFWKQLQLGGYCPVYSPTHPGVQMQYRFLYATGNTTLAAAINASQTSITVAGGAVTPATPFNVMVCICSPTGETGETMTVTNVSATTWTVLRGQEGTTAAVAAAGATLFINPARITGPLVGPPALVGQRIISWPQNLSGIAGATLVPTFEPVYVGYGTDILPPGTGAGYVGPKHYIPPDPITGWVPVDTTLIAGDVQTFLNFDTTQPAVAPGGYPFGSSTLAIGNPGGSPAGSPVPATNQEAGTDLSIIFQATRVGVSTVDYSNSLCKIHVNNWTEVNNLWFLEFITGGAGCCTPIDATLSVQFTVDHEEMDSGGWSLSITSCSGSAPGNITPNDQTTGVTFTPGDNVTTLAAAITAIQTSITVASAATGLSAPFTVSVDSTGETLTVTNVAGTTWTVNRGQAGTVAAAAAAGATLVAYRGAWGTIVENTSGWLNCSYTVTLSTRPGLTTGLVDRQEADNFLTFCICGH